MLWLQLPQLVCASFSFPALFRSLTSLPLTARLASTKVTVRFVSHVSLNTGVPKAGAAGHWMVASAGQLVTVGALLSITVIDRKHTRLKSSQSFAVYAVCFLHT